MLRRLAIAGSLALTYAAFLVMAPSASAALFPQCPPVGQNNGCSILIVISGTGTASVQADPNPPNNGPYDGSEDTLVGLQNNSSIFVGAINLSSASRDIFGFDGDGICDPSTWPGGPGNGAAAGCPSPAGFGPTGYEGPNVSFANISADLMSGTVKFPSAIPPGSSAYFALEETLSFYDVAVGAVTPGANPYAASKVPKCHGKSATIVGTPASNSIRGTNLSDVIVSLDGNDVIRARQGNDLICSGPGQDQIFGGLGNDHAYGGSDNDRLFGAKDADKLVGNGGRDSLFGGSGNDKLFGKNGNDKLFGSINNDTLFGGRGSDTLVCGNGLDKAFGGAGQDVAKRCNLPAVG